MKIWAFKNICDKMIRSQSIAPCILFYIRYINVQVYDIDVLSEIYVSAHSKVRELKVGDLLII